MQLGILKYCETTNCSLKFVINNIFKLYLAFNLVKMLAL